MALERGYKLKGPQGGNKGEIPMGRPFRYQGVDYPADWITRGGTLPGVATIEPFDNRPPVTLPTSWWVPLSEVFARLNMAQMSTLAGMLDSLSADVRWGFYAGQKVKSDDASFRSMISSLPGSPDPDVILGR